MELSVQLWISIHSLRVEGDRYVAFYTTWIIYFNPLPPCGGRLDILADLFIEFRISIHSLRVEGDSKIAQLSA